VSHRLVIWGAGELGGHVAMQAAAAGATVLAVTATPARHPSLAAAGVQVAVASAAPRLDDDDRLLLAVPGHVAQLAVLETLTASAAVPQRAVLVGTTGYYGDAPGAIDEASPAGCDARCQAIAALEQRWRDWAGSAAVVVRCGGLYRAGRGPLAALLRRGSAPLGPPNRTLALIHYIDAATACAAALTHSAPHASYLAVTPPCPTREQFYRAACTRHALPAPDFDEPLPWPPATHLVTRLRHDLLPQPHYPDWQSALEA
jgi:nucleoside-diphosphate-sugar epimerase